MAEAEILMRQCSVDEEDEEVSPMPSFPKAPEPPPAPDPPSNFLLSSPLEVDDEGEGGDIGKESGRGEAATRLMRQVLDNMAPTPTLALETGKKKTEETDSIPVVDRGENAAPGIPAAPSDVLHMEDEEPAAAAAAPFSVPVQSTTQPGQPPPLSPQMETKPSLPSRFPIVPDVTTTWPGSSGASSSSATERERANDQRASATKVAVADVEEATDDAKVASGNDEEIAWNRPAAVASEVLASAGAPASSAATSQQAQTQAPAATTEKPPLLQRVKAMVCRLPDPTLIFLVEAGTMLALHAVRPDLLRTWVARLIVPTLLLPTVAAAALWRPTHVVALPGRAVLNPIKPVPDAPRLVSKGEALRKREAAVIQDEETLRVGQLKLEMLRQEIQRKLPPAVSISNMLANEKSIATGQHLRNP